MTVLVPCLMSPCLILYPPSVLPSPSPFLTGARGTASPFCHGAREGLAHDAPGLCVWCCSPHLPLPLQARQEGAVLQPGRSGEPACECISVYISVYVCVFTCASVYEKDVQELLDVILWSFPHQLFLIFAIVDFVFGDVCRRLRSLVLEPCFSSQHNTSISLSCSSAEARLLIVTAC